MQPRARASVAVSRERERHRGWKVNGLLVGGLWCWDFSDNHTEITMLFVDAHWRGRGIATKLLKNECRRADLRGVTLTLEPSSKRLVKFYRRFGFEPVDATEDDLEMRRPPKC
jgi:ribosomal protein S18 acetylase RimI-like enzyme